MPPAASDVEQLAVAFARTGDYAAAAAECGLTELQARIALTEHSLKLLTRLENSATRRGLREGRRLVFGMLTEARERMATIKEHRDYASVATVVIRSAEVLARLDEHRDRILTARVARTRTRAETKLLNAKAAGLVPPDIHVTVSDPAEIDALLQRHFGSKGAKADEVPDTTIDGRVDE